MSSWPMHKQLAESDRFKLAMSLLGWFDARPYGHRVHILIDGERQGWPSPTLERLVVEWCGVDYDALLVEMDMIADEAADMAALLAEQAGRLTP